MFNRVCRDEEGRETSLDGREYGFLFTGVRGPDGIRTGPRKIVAISGMYPMDVDLCVCMHACIYLLCMHVQIYLFMEGGYVSLYGCDGS